MIDTLKGFIKTLLCVGWIHFIVVIVELCSWSHSQLLDWTNTGISFIFQTVNLSLFSYRTQTISVLDGSVFLLAFCDRLFYFVIFLWLVLVFCQLSLMDVSFVSYLCWMVLFCQLSVMDGSILSVICDGYFYFDSYQ